MKKILNIIFALLLCACSPQKQLANLLQKHPELQRTDTLVLNDTIILEPARAEIEISKAELQELLASEPTAEQNQNIERKEFSVSVGNSLATLSAREGKIYLSAEQKTDTIFIEREIQVPTFLTATEYRDKEVYKLHWWQKPIYWLGWLFLLIIIIWICAWCINHFSK